MDMENTTLEQVTDFKVTSTMYEDIDSVPWRSQDHMAKFLVWFYRSPFGPKEPDYTVDYGALYAQFCAIELSAKEGFQIVPEHVFDYPEREFSGKPNFEDDIVSRALKVHKIPGREDALETLKSCANNLHPRAAHHYAVSLDAEAGTDLNCEAAKQAFKYYVMAAVYGHAASCANVGMCYTYGRGVAQNKELANLWMDAALCANSTRNWVLFGILHGDGIILPENKAYGQAYLEAAVENGDPQAYLELGLRLKHGQFESDDPLRAVTLFREGANLGESYCMLELFEGLLEAARDPDLLDHEDLYEEASKWLVESAIRGNDVAKSLIERGGVVQLGNGAVMNMPKMPALQ